MNKDYGVVCTGYNGCDWKQEVRDEYFRCQCFDVFADDSSHAATGYSNSGDKRHIAAIDFCYISREGSCP